MKDNYKILGVSENATDEEIDAAYVQLKRKYQAERFYEGKVGNDAAKNLTKLENAYAAIVASRKENSEKTGAPNFSAVEQLIKDGKLNEAQSILDDFSDRNGEWHYLQAVLFYKKNWINESKKQLEIALDIDPSNVKYRTAYEKMKAQTEFSGNQQQFHSGNANYQEQQQNVNNRQMGDSGCGAFFDCLATWCCMNMLCDGCCR